MKTSYRDVVVILASGVSLFGCGGEAPDSAVAQGEPSSRLEVLLGRPSSAPDDASSTGEVGEFKACCYIKCKNQPLAGPYPNVEYGNCTTFAKYQCRVRNSVYESAAWKDC
ncbi:hypothetical protein JGU66_13040 [Myxococcaceae bacterium JPH2]|nr:hypothetical protein [Myxococcaceae bacterium JPH2]